MRIALLFPQPVYDSSEGGNNTIRKLAFLFRRHGHNVTVFSLGDKNRIIKQKNYLERVIRSFIYYNDGKMFTNLVDYATLGLFSRRFSYIIMNNNRTLIEELSKFHPEIIISTGQYFNSLLNYYKIRIDKNVKLITSTDDIRGAEESMHSFQNENRGGKIFTIIHTYLSHLVTEGYLRYAKQLYKECIVQYDAVTYVSEEDRKSAAKSYPKYSHKMFVVPPPKDIEKYRLQIKKHANRVLFVGNCRANKASMDARNKIIINIAPKTPNMTFVLTGKGCPRFKKGNVVSLGFVKDLHKVIEVSDICVAPLEIGSGLKTKVLTYFSAKKPVVGTHVAFEGFPVKNMKNCIIEDDLKKYPHILSELSDNVWLRRTLAMNGGRISNYFSEAFVNRRWEDIFKKLK